MSGKGRKKQGDRSDQNGRQAVPREEKPSGTYATRRSSWRKFFDLLFPSGQGDQPINEVHDRRPDYGVRNDPELDRASKHEAASAELLQLDERVTSLERSLKNLQDTMRVLQSDLGSLQDNPSRSTGRVPAPQPPRPSPFDRDPSWDEALQTQVARPTVRLSGREALRSMQSSPSTSRVDLETLDRAVCRFLGDEPGTWQMDRLLDAIQISLGHPRIDVEHLGAQSSDEWRLAILWPADSREGLVLVSSGELADDEISQYFEIDFGRRILACRQPARVTRQGSELSVLRKGKVASS